MSDWIELFNGRDVTGWTAAGDHAWKTAAGVSPDSEDPTRLCIEPGHGVLINGDTGRTLDIRTSTEHGSCDLSLDFCVPQPVFRGSTYP